MEPDEWLCAAFSIGEADKAFKLISVDPASPTATGVVVRVLHKESGAVWKFRCFVERKGIE